MEEYAQSLTQTQIQENLQIITNNFQFNLDIEDKQIFTYQLVIQPELSEIQQENKILSTKILSTLKLNQDFKKNYQNSIVQDLRIYSPLKIDFEQYFSNEELQFNFEETQYTISIKPLEDVTLSSLGFVVERIYRKLMKNIGLQQAGYSKFIEPKNLTQKIDDTFYLQKNYETVYVSEFGKDCLQVQQSCKIMNNDCYLDKIYENINNLDTLKGEKIISEHSGKLFIVDQICTNMNIFNNFYYENELISYYEYFENRYDYQIQDFNQPLIKTTTIIGDKNLYIVPEVCHTLNTNKNPKYKNLQEKSEIMKQIQPDLQTRQALLQEFIQKINQNEQNIQLFQQWGISLNNLPIKCVPYTIDLGSYRKLENFDTQVQFQQNTFKEFFSFKIQRELLTKKIVILQPIELKEKHRQFIETLQKRKNSMLQDDDISIGNIDNSEMVDNWVLRINAFLYKNQEYKDQQNSIIFILLLNDNIAQHSTQLRNLIELKYKQKAFYIPQSAFDKPNEVNQECVNLLDQMHKKRTLMQYQIDDLPQRFYNYGNLVFSYSVQKISLQNNPGNVNLNQNYVISFIASKFHDNGVYEIYYNQSKIVQKDEIPEILPQIANKAIEEYQKAHQIKKTCNNCNKSLVKVKDPFKNAQKSINQKQHSCVSCELNIKGQCYQCASCKNVPTNICLVCYNTNKIETLVIYRKFNYGETSLNENKEEIEFDPIIEKIKEQQIKNVVFINVINNKNLKLMQFNRELQEYQQPFKGTLLSQDYTNNNSSFIMVSHNLTNNNNKMLIPVQYEIQDNLEISENVIQDPNFLDDLIVLSFRLTNMYLNSQCSHKMPADLVYVQKLVDYTEQKFQENIEYEGTTNLQNINPLFFVALK